MTESQPKRRGCLFYGCLTGIVCVLAILGAFFLGLYKLKQMLNNYTDAQPIALPTVQMAAGQLEDLEQRVANFGATLETNGAAAPLVLTGDDLNALIAHTAPLQSFKGRAYLTVHGDRLEGQVSWPLAELGLPIFHGRYLNGTARFTLNLEHGRLQIVPEQILVKDRPIPSLYLKRIQQENLAANLPPDSAVTRIIDRLETIQIQDGKITIVPRNKAP